MYPDPTNAGQGKKSENKISECCSYNKVINQGVTDRISHQKPENITGIYHDGSTAKQAVCELLFFVTLPFKACSSVSESILQVFQL